MPHPAPPLVTADAPPRARQSPIGPVLPSQADWPLFDAAASRQIEHNALAASKPQALMALAGLAVARLALAIGPTARQVWIAAGPGNNGGDGLVAGRLLQQQGWSVRIGLMGGEGRQRPADAAWALQQAQAAGVHIEAGLAGPASGAGICIDALLGLGNRRAPQGDIAQAVRLLNASAAPVLAVDLPTGLCGDTGRRLGDDVVNAAHTLALLTLKPGLFTGQGRDQAGRVWLADLGIDLSQAGRSATLQGPGLLHRLLPGRSHAQHKGSFGDLLVIGGAPGMGGAASLAARAALAAGAGRVYLARLDGDEHADALRPELMPRSLAQVLQPAGLASATVVCGCGGGSAVAACLPAVLAQAARLVLDADALNAVANDPALLRALHERRAKGQPSVLTPHPLEAARLLGRSTADVQADRLAAARDLATLCQCTVVLKGSGTVIATPGGTPVINPTGNARLGSAGSGDVLAGWLGGLWSQTFAIGAGSAGDFEVRCASGLNAACAAVWLHGRAAEIGNARLPLRAADLIDVIASALPPWQQGWQPPDQPPSRAGHSGPSTIR